MFITFAKNYLLPCVGALTLLSPIGCGVESTEESLDLQSATEALKTKKAPTDLQWWRVEREKRQAAVEAYVEANQEDWESFKNTPLGNTGVPTIMLRLFPQIFPDIWGPYDAYMAAQGFGPDGLEEGRVLPLGLGHMNSTTVLANLGTPEAPKPVYLQSSSLTCAGCHLGRVDGPEGQTLYLPGAPNGQFGPFRGSVYATVTDTTGRYTAGTFRTALAALPFGSIYPADPVQETVERRAFMTYVPEAGIDVAASMLAGLKAGSVAGAQRYYLTVGINTNNVPNPPAATPGNLDALAAGFALVVNPAVLTAEQVKAVLPKAPAPVDIMSVWLQADRPAAQWDGSIPGKLHRNLAASLGVIGNPAAVNVDNGIRTTRFTENLPAPVYPFDVSRSSVARGEKVFRDACQSCHTPGAERIFGLDEVGTDPNRAVVWSDYTLASLGAAVAASCKGDPACDGQPSPVIQSTGGYMAIPLSGIWASAPYLHNGSVPSLRALLTGDRPTTFCRGNTEYNEDDVGFSTECPDGYVPGVGSYNTTQSGNGNAGHTGPEFNGYYDWAKNARALEDLLEYLKTM